MKERSKTKVTALTAVMTAFVYAMTSISIPMPPPLGVWHIGDIASFTVAILFGPVAYTDLITFFPLSVLDIIVTVPLLASIRKALKTRYVIE